MKSRRKGTKKNKKTRRKRGGMETTTPPTRRNSPVTSPFIPPIALPPPAPLPTITTLNARFQEDSMEDTYQDSMRRAINSGENYAPRILQILQRHLDDYQGRQRDGYPALDGYGQFQSWLHDASTSLDAQTWRA